MESIQSGTYTSLRTEPVSACDNYYIIPEASLAIPVCITSNDTFQLVASKLGAFELPEHISELPTVSSVVLQTALSHYTIVPVLRSVLVTKPVKVLSPMEVEAIRESKRKQNYISKKKSYITGTLDLSVL
jgi:hypothetical protein